MNRYAWTNIGPVVVIGGKSKPTGTVRRQLARKGIVVERWARNFVETWGWDVVEVIL